MFWTKCLIYSPRRKAGSVPGVCSSCLNKVRQSYTTVSNRKELPAPQTPATKYKPVSSSPISGRRHACACQEQSLHVEITMQHGVFQRFMRKERGGVVSSLVLVTDVYVPVQPSKANYSAGRTGGTRPAPRNCLHLKLSTCKEHLVMVLFGEIASGKQIRDTKEIKDALMAYIIKWGCTFLKLKI